MLLSDCILLWFSSLQHKLSIIQICQRSVIGEYCNEHLWMYCVGTQSTQAYLLWPSIQAVCTAGLHEWRCWVCSESWSIGSVCAESNEGLTTVSAWGRRCRGRWDGTVSGICWCRCRRLQRWTWTRTFPSFHTGSTSDTWKCASWQLVLAVQLLSC